MASMASTNHLLCQVLFSIIAVVPFARSYLLIPSHLPVGLRAAHTQASLRWRPNALALGPSPRTLSRIPLQVTKMSGVESCVPQLEQSFEAALIAGIPNASEEDLEELLAILTTTARSLERRLKQGREDASNARGRFISALRQKLVEEEALLGEDQWTEVTTIFDSMNAHEQPAPFDPTAAIAEIESELEQGVAGLGGSISAGDAAELKAMVTIVCRSFSRRIAQGRAEAGSAGELRDKVAAALEERVVHEEGLLSPALFAALLARPPPSASSHAPAMPAPAPTAAAGRDGASAGAAGGGGKSEMVGELQRLFPSHSAAELEAIAGRSPDLEAAVFEVLSLPRATDSDADSSPLELLAAAETIGEWGGDRNKAVGAGGGGKAGALQTPGVTTGACSFGVCLDVRAKERDVVITGLRTAASPGLNWGQGMPLRVAVFATKEAGSGRGRELDRDRWVCVGKGDAVTLPMVSWADTAPEYGPLPLSQSIRVPAGTTRGLLVHTSDLYGLVTAVGCGAGGSDEMLGDEEPAFLHPGSLVAQDEALELLAGYTIGAAVFEEFDGLAIPAAVGFVGVIDYSTQ